MFSMGNRFCYSALGFYCGLYMWIVGLILLGIWDFSTVLSFMVSYAAQVNWVAGRMFLLLLGEMPMSDESIVWPNL